MSSSIHADALQPRECHVKKWDDFNGYGFNLHAEKGKHGHHIGALDRGSPAEAAGLKEGDRIVEVNGTNIANENHQQVVSRIKAVANEVKLLVVDAAADEYYREKKVVVRGDMPGVVHITTPASKAVYDADPMAGYAAAAAAVTDDAEPQPRLAKLRTWPDFQGFGFNLTTEKNKPGQYIGKVDSDSPASTAGVREGDRIIEVNGVNVTEETHHQVVNRIKARPGQVDLLLVDKATDQHYVSKGTVVRGDMPQVHVQETPESSKGAVPNDVTPEEAAVAVAAVAAAAETAPAEEVAAVKAAVEEEAVTASVEEVTEEEAAAAVAAVAAVAVVAEAAEAEAAEAEAAEAAVVPEAQAAPEAQAVPESDYDLPSPMAAAEVAIVAAAVEVAAVESDAPRPRLCLVRKWPTFQGYGFTLNAGGPKGHFIGSADKGSPAEAAGLRKDDKIIEVNGSSIFEDDHKTVIGKITTDPSEVKLLVADEVTEAYYKEKKIKIHSSMSEVEVIECPREEPTAAEVAAVAEAEVAVAAVAVEAVAAAVEEEVGPSPRLCHLKRWSDFQGYGFNLNAEKGRVGNFIGGVDKDSPAEAAGVQAGDNIIEVNGDDVETANHGVVVGKITSDKTQVKMLLVDTATHDYYQNKGVKISSSLPNVKVIVCPDANPGTSATTAVAAVGVPRPRLHHLKKWPNFPGYGFNLHERLKQPGHLIGSVDPDSPAEATGLRVDDKIIEVNGKNMLECSHHQVVDRIKQYSDRVSLLVVDDTTDRYYHDKGVWIHSKMPNIEEIECPSSNDKAPRPRLFHLLKWPDFQGYGFDLHEEKTRPGHLIGSVDPGSPSAFVGMRRDDKIIEVNGHNVLEESHKRVVERITENEGFVKLLVVDSVAEQYYNDNSIWVHGRMDNIDVVECPAQTPAAEPTVTATTENSVSVHAHMDTIDHASSVLGIADVKPKPPRHTPRLCQLQLSPQFPGYGFDLQNEKDREGHFVGAIEENSPAGQSTLREGDRVVEVNGVNVENTDHPDVVKLIKDAGGSLKLLVVDDQAWHYYVNNNIKIREDLVQVREEVVHVNGAAAAAVENGHHSSSSRSSSVGVSRLCHLQSNPASPGYGFELHRLEKTKGHFIGPIDPGSPAENAGLHKGDEIVEINGTNIQKKSHNEVVYMLKENQEKVMLLVTNKNPLSAPASVGLTNGAQLRHQTPHARHCHLKKWSDFDGYGFDLYEIRKTPGPRIGSIANGSPAEATGFKQDDYVIEVNGKNVEKLRHPDMVKKIGGTTQVRMLLVDPAAHSHFKGKSVRIHSGMENVENIYCPDNRNVVAVTSGPRRVQLKTIPGFSGFGFDLQELTNKPGHYVGGVDPGSPAAAAGLEREDQIVEVNDQSIVKDSHDEVVNKIKQTPGEVSLLVVSAGSNTVYHSNALWVNTGNRDTVIMVPAGEQSHSADVVDNSNTVISETAPRPRLCKLQRWADYSGYGFDLHEEKNRAGHLIGSVDPGSPAETAGLKVNDQIVEVNSHNVLESSHQEVVQHIKQHEDRVDMLVLDNNAKDYYDDNSIWVHSKMSNVNVIECPRRSSQAVAIPIPVPVPEVSTVAANGAEPALRLCVLKKWSDYSGYGFNLHDEKGIAGHFIGSVDADSPADKAGLRAQDKIVEVNGEPVFDDDHHEVVRKVTSKPDGVELLVMDQSGDEYFRTQNVKPHGGMSNITVITCPPHKDSATTGVVEETHVVEEHHSVAPVITVTSTEHTHTAAPESLRLCTLKKWQDYSGYGFNLHDERGKPGHFIGGVETGSPAESAGLKVGYQLYEVNGNSVKSADHSLVIEHVLSNPDQVQLLIGPADESQQYTDYDSWPHSNLANVTTHIGSDSSPATTLAAHTMAEPEPVIRLCHLRKWTTYEGYGFRLHDDKNKPGHFIGPLEPGSPAEMAGLHKGDRVMEVNGFSTEDMNHHQVVNKIVANPGEVRLLVLDPAADRHYAHRAVWPHGAMPNVSRSECPLVQPAVAHTNGVAEVKVDEIEVVEHNGHAYVAPEREPAREPSPVQVRAPTPEPVRAPTPEPIRVPTPEPVRAPTPEPIVEAPRVPTPEPVHHREPSPPPQQVNEVVKTVVTTTVLSEMRNGTENKPHVERTTEIEVENHGSKMETDGSTIVVPAHVDIAPVVVTSNELQHQSVEVSGTHTDPLPTVVATTSPAHTLETVAQSDYAITEVKAVPPPPIEEPRSEARDEHLVAYPTVMERVVIAEPVVRHNADRVQHTRPASATYSRVEVVEVGASQPDVVAVPLRAEPVSVVSSQNDRMAVRQSAPTGSIVVAGREETIRSEVPTHGVVTGTSATTTITQHRVVENVASDDGFVITTPLYAEVKHEPTVSVNNKWVDARERMVEAHSEVEVKSAKWEDARERMVEAHAEPVALKSANWEDARERMVEVHSEQAELKSANWADARERMVEVHSESKSANLADARERMVEVHSEPAELKSANWEDARERMVTVHSEQTEVKPANWADARERMVEVHSESAELKSANWADARERMVEVHSEAVELKSTTTAEGTFVKIGPSSSEIRQRETERSVSGGANLRGSEVVMSRALEEGEPGIVLLDYRTHHVEPVTSKLPQYHQMSHHEEHGTITMTEEIDTSGIHIVPPPPPLPEEMSSHTHTREEVTYVESSVPQEDKSEAVSDHTTLITTTGALAAVASDRLSISSAADSEASSTAAAGYSFQESEITTETSEIAQESHGITESSVNGVSEVVVVASEISEPEEPLYQNREAIEQNLASTVVAVAPEPVHVSAEQVDVVESHEANYETSATTTTTTTEVVTLTSRTVRESGHFDEAAEEIVAAPPPTEFTDVHNGSSRRSSASTLSDSATQYAFTTETENEDVSEFMSSSVQPTVIRTTSTTSSSYSYQKPAYEPEPYKNSQPAAAPADALGGLSLQEALNRARSRKKPKAGTGNLSMKEKFELFQQL